MKSKLRFNLGGGASSHSKSERGAVRRPFSGFQTGPNIQSQGFMSKLSLLKQMIFDDLSNKDAENEYPFDDGWKCNVF